jgi:holo-[acyl-carrier protein] synthase
MAIVGIGTEIVECVRIAKMIETHGEQFLQRVYTPREVEYCMNRPRSMQHFAARWAVKESFIKALRIQHHGIRWTEIELVMTVADGPLIQMSGMAQMWSDQSGIDRWLVSLGACRTHATAYVVATDADG